MILKILGQVTWNLSCTSIKQHWNNRIYISIPIDTSMAGWTSIITTIDFGGCDTQSGPQREIAIGNIIPMLLGWTERWTSAVCWQVHGQSHCWLLSRLCYESIKISLKSHKSPIKRVWHMMIWESLCKPIQLSDFYRMRTADVKSLLEGKMLLLGRKKGCSWN